MKESAVCQRYRQFYKNNYKNNQPFPITVQRLLAYVKYRGRSLSTFHSNLIGLEKHAKHGQDWIRQVRHNPEILKLIDHIDNQIKQKNKRHQSLRSQWNLEQYEETRQIPNGNNVVFGLNGSTCREVKGPKNKGFVVTLNPTSHQSQENGISFVPTFSLPPLSSPSSSSSSRPTIQSPPTLEPTVPTSFKPTTTATTISSRVEEFRDVWYDPDFDDEINQEIQVNHHHHQDNEDSFSFIFDDDDDDEVVQGMIKLSQASEQNGKSYEFLENFDFDNLEFSDHRDHSLNSTQSDNMIIDNQQRNEALADHGDEYDYDFDFDDYNVGEEEERGGEIERDDIIEDDMIGDNDDQPVINQNDNNLTTDEMTLDKMATTDDEDTNDQDADCASEYSVIVYIKTRRSIPQEVEEKEKEKEVEKEDKEKEETKKSKKKRKLQVVLSMPTTPQLTPEMEEIQIVKQMILNDLLSEVEELQPIVRIKRNKRRIYSLSSDKKMVLINGNDITAHEEQAEAETEEEEDINTQESKEDEGIVIYNIDDEGIRKK